MYSVDRFPLEESAYWVRSRVGNARKCCLDLFCVDGPPLKNGLLMMPSEEDLNDMTLGLNQIGGGRSYGLHQNNDQPIEIGGFHTAVTFGKDYVCYGA